MLLGVMGGEGEHTIIIPVETEPGPSWGEAIVKYKEARGRAIYHEAVASILESKTSVLENALRECARLVRLSNARGGMVTAALSEADRLLNENTKQGDSHD